MNSTLRGVFLTSKEPCKTAEFYERVAMLSLEMVGVEGEYVYWKIDNNGMQLAIHEAKAFADYSFPPNPQSNLTHLYFKIENQDEFLAHLQKLGVVPFAVDEITVTVIDPDGRKVMFGTA